MTRAAFSLALLTFFAGTSVSAAADKPNVVFIISDDLGAQSLGCYGNTQCRTPNIDALAARGVRFARTYTQYPVCGPSRAALMSGMYAQAIGVTSNGASGSFTKNLGKRPSMSQHFMNHGYYAARISKIYHMRVPGDITAGVNGPDHAASWTARFNCRAPEQWSTGEHEHLTNEKLKPDPNRRIHYGLGYGGAFYIVRGSTDGAEQADQQAAAKAIEVLEHRAEDGRPFFLAVGLVRPHVPLVSPASFFKPYLAENINLPSRRDGDWDDIPQAGISKNSVRSGLSTRQKQQRVLGAYYAAVSYMDAQVGKIIAAVDRLGLRGNTVLVFTSDHGYHLGEHDFWQKMSLHEESTRIPLIIHAPDRRPGVSRALSQQIDIYPTLADICNLPSPPHIQGKSLVKVLDAPAHRVHEEVYCLRGRNDHLLRTDRWALIRYGRGGVELYDMQADPHQFTNLAGAPRHRQTLSGLLAKLDDKLESIKQKRTFNK